MKKRLIIFCLAAPLLMAACHNVKRENAADPCAQKTKLSGGTTFSGNSNGDKHLSGTPYGYETWSAHGENTKFIWRGPKQGGGAAFRAEWNNANDFLARAGYFWDEGKPYPHYKNVSCDFNFTRSENGTAGNYSYIGVYGWSKEPMIEWYIVEDWYGTGIIGPENIGGGAVKKGEFTVDGAVYYIYEATRPAGSGNIEGSSEPFQQYFSIRQQRRQCGTISIAKHFKEWEKLGMKLGGNMYESKFLVEASGGAGWFDASYLSFYRK